MAGETVLIVEDNPLNRELVSDLLDAAGYEVLAASTAEEGIQVARKRPLRLILLDITLPGMSGFEALEALKKDDRTKDVPTVALTAHSTSGDQDRIMDAGFDGFLSKPLDTRAFAETVASHLGGAGSS
jgi:CheY-like chemotaxis protein